MPAKPLHNWRVTPGLPYGSHVWFDPSTERVEIHPLTAGVGPAQVDKVGSVSESGSGENFVKPGHQRDLPLGGLPF